MEKLSSTPKRLMLGGIVVGLVVAALLFLVRPSAPERPAGERQATTSTVEVQASKTAAPSPLPVDEVSKPLDRPPLMPDEIIAEILKKDEKLRSFRDYHETVLLDEKRRDEYRKLLSDPAMMTAMAEELMKPGNGPVDPEEHYRRLMQIDYFDAALNWKDNPQRQKVLELTGDIIARDNFDSDQNRERRQMLAGSKMELYRLMSGQDGTKAQELVAQAQGTRMEALVNWMAQEDVRRRVKEEEIRKEMQEQQTKAN